MRLKFLVLAFLCGLGGVLGAEDPRSEDLVTLRLVPKVLGASNQVSWQDSVDRLTLIGKGVTLTIDGQNFRLRVLVTPYRAKNNNFLLVVQSQINGVKPGVVAQASTVQTLEVSLGEKVVFFPMGTKDPQKEDHSLMLEISVHPYQAP